MNGSPNVLTGHEQSYTSSTATIGRDAIIVDLAICVASVLGALSIIVPFSCSKASRKLRHALIVGLATSDLSSSLVIITSSAYALAGGDLTTSMRLCTFLGYWLATSIFTQHLWTLIIALATYMLLVHPLSSFTSTLERRLIWLWPVFWAFSMVVNGFGWGFVGFSYAGGYCYFSPEEGKLFTPLLQFVPRALVVIITVIIYTRLFIFLRRENIFAATSQRERSSPSQISHAGSRGRRDAESRDPTPDTSRRSSAATAAVSSRARDVVRHYLSSLTIPIVSKSRTRPLEKGGDRSGEVTVFQHPFAPADGPLDMEMREYKAHEQDGISPLEPSSSSAPPSSGFGASLKDLPFKLEDASSSKPSVVFLEPTVRASTPPPFSNLDSPDLQHRRTRSLPESAGSPTLPSSPKLGSVYGDRRPTDPISSPLTRSTSSASRAGPSSLFDSSLADTAVGSIRRPRPSRTQTATSDTGLLAAHTRASGPLFLPTKSRFPTSESHDASWDKNGPWSANAAPESRRKFSAPNDPYDSRWDAGPWSAGAIQTRFPEDRWAQSDDDESPLPASDPFANYTVVRMPRRRDTVDFKMSSPPQEHLSHISFRRNPVLKECPSSSPPRRRSEDTSGGLEGQQKQAGTTTGGAGAGEVALAVREEDEYERALGADWTWGMPVGGGGHGHGHGNNLRRGSAGPAGADRTTRTQTSVNTNTDESSTNIESLGSQLNRQASLLMLLYPAAYCLLFSVSIIRIIDDLTNPTRQRESASQNALHSISRWFIFAQGAFDAIIFQFIERHFRKRLKHKRRKALGEELGEAWWRRAWTWVGNRRENRKEGKQEPISLTAPNTPRR